MNHQNIKIKEVKRPLSIDIQRFETEAQRILTTVVIPQVKKAEKIKKFDRKRCVIPRS